MESPPVWVTKPPVETVLNAKQRASTNGVPQSSKATIITKVIIE